MAAVMICATAASDTRAPSPVSTSSRDAASKCGAIRSIQPCGSFSPSCSEANIDISVAQPNIDLAQPCRRISRMAAGLDVELVAVPWADDVRVGLVEVEHAHPALCVHRLDHPAHDAALAHRAAAMRAPIVPRIELAIDAEHA